MKNNTPDEREHAKKWSFRTRIAAGVGLWGGFLLFLILVARIDFSTARMMPYMGMLLFFIGAFVHTSTAVTRQIGGAGLRRLAIIFKWPLAIVMAVFVLRGVEVVVMQRYLADVEKQLGPLIAHLRLEKRTNGDSIVSFLEQVRRIKSLRVWEGEGRASVDLQLPAMDSNGYVVFYDMPSDQWYYYHRDLSDRVRPRRAAGHKPPIPPKTEGLELRYNCQRINLWSCFRL